MSANTFGVILKEFIEDYFEDIEFLVKEKNEDFSLSAFVSFPLEELLEDIDNEETSSFSDFVEKIRDKLGGFSHPFNIVLEEFLLEYEGI